MSSLGNKKERSNLNQSHHDRGLFEAGSLPPISMARNVKRLTRKRKFSLREVIRRVPSANDMFPQVFEKGEIIKAVDRVLEKDGDGVFCFWFLNGCAEEVSFHYPEIAALILEHASAAVARGTGNNTPLWQRGYIDAADYWLKAGDREQRQDVLLKAAALTLQSGNQLNLWTGNSDISMEPLWLLAREYSEGEKPEEAIGVCRKIIDHGEMENRVGDVLRARMICGHEYARLDNWSEVRRISEEILDAISMFRENSIYEFDAHLMLGIALLKQNIHRHISTALGEFDEAKRVLQEGKECDEDDSERLYKLLGRVWGLQCELNLEDYVKGGKENSLKQAEEAGQFCIAYLEKLVAPSISDLGNAYAMLNTIFTLAGDVDLAGLYREKAMLLGFDLSEE